MFMVHDRLFTFGERLINVGNVGVAVTACCGILHDSAVLNGTVAIGTPASFAAESIHDGCDFPVIHPDGAERVEKRTLRALFRDMDIRPPVNGTDRFPSLFQDFRITRGCKFVPVGNHARMKSEVFYILDSVKIGKRGFPATVCRLNRPVLLVHFFREYFFVVGAGTVIPGFVEQFVNEGIYSRFQQGRGSDPEAVPVKFPPLNGIRAERYEITPVRIFLCHSPYPVGKSKPEAFRVYKSEIHIQRCLFLFFQKCRDDFRCLFEIPFDTVTHCRSVETVRDSEMGGVESEGIKHLLIRIFPVCDMLVSHIAIFLFQTL